MTDFTRQILNVCVLAEIAFTWWKASELINKKSYFCLSTTIQVNVYIVKQYKLTVYTFNRMNLKLMHKTNSNSTRLNYVWSKTSSICTLIRLIIHTSLELYYNYMGLLTLSKSLS